MEICVNSNEKAARFAAHRRQEAADLYTQAFKPLVQAHETVDQAGLDVFRLLALLDHLLLPRPAQA